MSVGDPAVPMTVDGTDSTVKWSTEDSGVATVNSDGEVTAVASGKTTVDCRGGWPDAEMR